ncbi:hypothetical protein [Phytohabitans houttuyneae]|uniref:Uncharacterized protein n=1 Tax=Phytohabitans houttuyneae TaxID=1076126 RepID=A0A6V8KPA2_9ACTN|nr:hypothetical protein [Phytohabitans houttuyneae]GFJ85230.1 hypothetical protein Phou_094100 [Phytohabitans houttuyneae]
MVYPFLAHRSPSKSRIFALVRADEDRLEAVTTLGAADVDATDGLVSALNSYLADRDEESLRAVVDRLPEAVRIAVRNFLRERCAFELGAFTAYGPIDDIRLCYFSRADEEFIRYLESAYMIGLGIRVTNELGSSGNVDWEVQLRSEEVFVPASAEPRAWALPQAPVLRTWTSAETRRDPVLSAVAVARGASDDGYWVRLHTIAKGDGEIEMESSSTSTFVVDVFEAPIPVSAHDE